MKIIQEKTFESARKRIRETDEKVVFSSNDDNLNRKILEKEKINVLLINQSGRKDFQKQRDAGFNQVLAKIAKKNKVAIGINLDEIVDSSPKEKLEILARIRQNIMVCNKNKLNMVFISIKHKRDIYDLRSLGLVLGMPTWMFKNSVGF